MKVTPLSKVMGAEVTGVDISKPLSAADRAQLYQAFLDHLLLCVRDQRFADIGAFLNAARHFGEPKVQHIGERRLVLEKTRTIFRRNIHTWTSTRRTPLTPAASKISV